MPTNATKFTSKQLIPGQQLSVTDLRIQFKITRGLTKAPNQCDVTIHNLKEDTRHDLQRPLSVRVDAGYDGVQHQLFIGDLRFGMSEQDGPSWKSLLQVGDGARTYAHARVNKAYKGNTTYRQVITDAASAMGFAVPPALASNSDLDREFNTGVAQRGPAREELTRLLSVFGLHWSIQDGVLQVLTDDQLANNDVLPVDKKHGMIGSPSYGTPPRSGKPPHMHVKMLLRPEIFPGCLIQLTSRDKNGKFRVERVVHDGDTRTRESLKTQLEIKEA